MRILGWDENQWAIAFSEFPFDESMGIRGAVNTKKQWMTKYYHQPEDNIILGINREKDYEDVMKLLACEDMKKSQ